ncbi:MAG: homoserine kinase [Streptosporangiales bacterium]|nr:homoserine kinase [Streptosporangiales bacterium]
MSGFATSPVQVRVPATSANLGPGFDTFGLALTRYDEVTAQVTGGGLDVRVEGEGSGELELGERHLVVRAMRAAFERLGAHPPGLALRCRNTIPHGRGLGSSAAAVVAGILAARALATGKDSGEAFGDEAVLDLASGFEGHPDNVAACLAGGLTLAWTSDGVPRFVRLEPAHDVVPVVCVPPERLATEEARRLLPATVPHGDAAANAARAALLVTALTGRPDLLFEATEDRLHQKYRAPAMPHVLATLQRLRTAGVPAVVSGAGPTILVLSDQSGVDLVGKEVGNGWHVHRLDVDRDGARVYSVSS